MNDKGEMRTESYSSSRYYEKAKVKLSTANKEVELEVEPQSTRLLRMHRRLLTVESNDAHTLHRSVSYGHRASRLQEHARYTFKKKGSRKFVTCSPNEFTIVIGD
jgi:hypothetical protein